MSKKSFFANIFVSVVLTLVLISIFGNFVFNAINRVPAFSRFQLFRPQAPIIITQRETSRDSSAPTVADIVNRSKSRVATIAIVSNNQVKVIGGAINLTASGVFMTVKAALVTPPHVSAFIINSNGQIAPIDQIVFDPATNLAIVTAKFDNLAPAALANSGDAAIGQPLVFLQNSALLDASRAATTSVSALASDVFGQILNSDHPTRSFSVEPAGPLIAGEALVNQNSEVLGIWDGTTIISSDVARQASNIFFANNQLFARPSFGFTYSMLSGAVAAVLQVPTGARVETVTGQAAKNSGLVAGDIITQASGQAVSAANSLEVILEKFKPGDSVALVVQRGHDTLNLNLAAEALK